MKKIIILIMLLFVTACSNNNASNDLDNFAETANLTAQETKEELYEKAKDEGILTIYTVSTRMMDVANAFEEEYPELITKVLDIRSTELIPLTKESIDNEIYEPDIIFCTDVNGALTRDLIPNGYAYKYAPYDMADKLVEPYYPELMPLFTEGIFITYNPTLFDEYPVSNWWELTEPTWTDRVYAPNPSLSVTTLSMFNMIIKNSDLFEQAYTEYYGIAFESENGENAGETFIRKLVENGLIIVASSDDIVDSISMPHITEPYLGLMVSSKLRLQSIGYNIDFCRDVSPFDGVTSSVNVMIAGGSQNINAAKLFVRFIFGETDGTGEGYKPYLQNGVWSMRTDVDSETTIPYESLNTIYSDEAYTADHEEEFFVFWESLFE